MAGHLTPLTVERLTTERGLREGYRSGLEERVAEELKTLGIPVLFETEVIEFEQPPKKRKYHPDFRLPNGVLIETKGRFTSADRQKHIWIKQQKPEIDLRFVFSNSRSRIAKGSKTSYADWCNRYGFKFADRSIPREWLK